MFDDIEKPKNATEWYELGLKHGIKMQHPESKWILDENKNIICRNCNYIAGYDAQRGYITGSYCCNCGAKMEELDHGKRG